MREGWEVKAFEDCIDRVRYPKKILKKSFLSEGEFPIISQEQEFINGYWDGGEEVFKTDTPVVIFGDHTKVLKYVDFDFVLGADGVKILRPKEFLFPKYFYYYLMAFPVSALGYARHYRILKELSVRFPTSLAEQKRIVGVLDQAFAGIEQALAAARKNRANARALFETTLNTTFTQKGEGWVENSLDKFCIVERGSSPRPIKQYITDDVDGVNWIKIGDTKGAVKYVSKTKQKITPQGALKSRPVYPGDFILTNSMSYGKPYIMNTAGYIHDGWFVLRLKEGVDTNFFYHLLTSRAVQDQFASLASGSVVKNISGDLVKKTVLTIPPLVKQLKLVENLENVQTQTQALEALYQRKIEALNDLKQSLLQQAFAGELTRELTTTQEDAA